MLGGVDVAREAIGAAAGLIRASRRTVALTGAGVSTESGIPDFSGTAGVESGYDPVEFAFDRFVSSPEARRRFWAWGLAFYPRIRDAEPNGAHHALAALERAGRLHCLVTQNIDELHREAGSHDVIELHGRAGLVGCLSCDAQWPREAVQARLEAGESDPGCDRCGGVIKPRTISFGQAMPEPETRRAFEEARRAEVLLVVGSSLGVFPAAGLVPEARRAGARVVLVNLRPTPYDRLAEVVLHGKAGEILPAIADAVLGGPASG